MKVLDRYIAGVVIRGTLVALLAVIGLYFFFSIISEIDRLAEGYTAAKMVEYVVLTVPRSVYELFPTAALLGGLIGMGVLAANNELIAMRAAGFSIWRIVRSVLQAGMIMLVVVVALGEFVAPKTEEYAQRLRAVALDKRISFMGREGIWVRDESRYIHVGNYIGNDQLMHIIAYEFAKDQQLVAATSVKRAEFVDEEWVLHNMQQSVFNGDSITTRTEETINWPTLITPELLDIMVLKPENMSVNDIRYFIKYLDANELNTLQYRYAFWRRITMPASALIMLLVSVPFAFGSLRSTGAGQRLFIGLVVGFTFYLVSQMLGQLGQIYGFNPLMANFAPGLLVFLLGVYAIRRI